MGTKRRAARPPDAPEPASAWTRGELWAAMQGVSAVLAVAVAVVALVAARSDSTTPRAVSVALPSRSLAIARTYEICCVERSQVLPFSQGGGAVEVPSPVPAGASADQAQSAPVRLTPDVDGLSLELQTLADAASIADGRNAMATVEEIRRFVRSSYGLELKRSTTHNSDRPDAPTGDGVPWTPILVVWGIGVLLSVSWWASSRRRAS